ncbi:MAG: SurA domain protein [Candidatus Aminicenantes bacterium]|nr:SurA domain protein [Candidatus Aminicenantes bacterium]
MRNRTRMFAAAGLAAALSIAAGQVVEEIVAVVNDEMITLSEFRQQYEATVQQLRGGFQGEELEKQIEFVRKEILNMMITDLLLKQKAREMSLNVADQVRSTVENIKKENNMESDDDLKRALQQQGIEYNDWLKQLEDNLLVQAVRYTEVDRAIVLDDAETVNYYKQHSSEFIEPEEYHIRAIYLATEGKEAQAIEDVKTLVSGKLKAGEPFNALAKEYSEGPGKEAEGDLGTFKKGELDKTLEQAASTLKAGELSDWLGTKNGWYLLKLDEKKASRQQTLDEVKRSIEDKMYAEKRQKKTDEYLKALREKSYVKILKPNPLDW